jgi:hypothetical protein
MSDRVAVSEVSEEVIDERGAYEARVREVENPLNIESKVRNTRCQHERLDKPNDRHLRLQLILMHAIDTRKRTRIFVRERSSG